MNPELTPEQSKALGQAPFGVLEVEDPSTRKTYVICDPELQRRAKAVLDREAITEGIKDVEHGATMPLADALEDVRSKLGGS